MPRTKKVTAKKAKAKGKRAPEEEPEDNESSNDEKQEEEETLKKRKTLHAPTVHDIVTDSLTHLSLQYWATAGMF